MRRATAQRGISLRSTRLVSAPYLTPSGVRPSKDTRTNFHGPGGRDLVAPLNITKKGALAPEVARVQPTKHKNKYATKRLHIIATRRNLQLRGCQSKCPPPPTKSAKKSTSTPPSPVSGAPSPTTKNSANGSASTSTLPSSPAKPPRDTSPGQATNTSNGTPSSRKWSH